MRDKGFELFCQSSNSADATENVVNFLKKARNLHKLKVLAIHFGKVPLRMSQ